MQGCKSHRRADGREFRTLKTIISACSMVDAFEWRFALPTTHKQEVVAVGRDGSCETERQALSASPALWRPIVWSG